MLRQFHEAFGIDIRLVGRFMRMNADRATDPGIALGDRQHFLELRDPGADGDQVRDAIGLGTRQDLRHLSGEVRKIEMAMAVDQPPPPFPIHSCRRLIHEAREHPLGFGQIRAGLERVLRADRTECAVALVHRQLIQDLRGGLRHQGLH